MNTSTIVYQGNLRTEATHTRSGKKFITDAPLDNNGKGEAFSPTDIVSTALGSCALTLMGIAANTHEIILGDIDIEITKHMADKPRKISAIDVIFNFNTKNYNEKERKILEKAAKTCPVSLSLHPGIAQNFVFNYK